MLPDAVRGLGIGWRWGFDPRLRRAVWLRFSDSGTPPVAPARRAVVRGTRLRWLAGRRLETEAWDAYEAVEGVPLSGKEREWVDVRWWLLDLAKECAATTAADRAPRSPERVWTLASGGIKWLDDPPADAVPPADSVATDQQLLIAFARNALGRNVEPMTARFAPGHPLPLGASRFFERLAGPAGSDMAETGTRARCLDEAARRPQAGMEGGADCDLCAGACIRRGRDDGDVERPGRPPRPGAASTSARRESCCGSSRSPTASS